MDGYLAVHDAPPRSHELQISSFKRASIAREVFVVDAAGNDVGDCFLALRKVSDGSLAVTTRRCLVALLGEEEEKEARQVKGFREDDCYLRDGDDRVHWHPCRFQRYC